MKYLITGADGFVGKNLISNLLQFPNVEILKLLRSDPIEKLDDMIAQSSCVIHLAGENRPESPDHFHSTNVQLTSYICKVLSNQINKIPLIFASSKQVEDSSAYGNSKLDAEAIIADYAKKSGGAAIIYRFPGIFGKWCKPNYNSVVSTFCYNITHDLPIWISDKEKVLHLVYIDDVVRDLILVASSEFSGLNYRSIAPEYQIKLGELANQLYRFKNMRQNLMVESVGGGIIGALYSTYLSFCPKENFSYQIASHQDHRGIFVEMLKTPEYGQFSYFKAPPGVTRGGHYHQSKSEKFLVVQGSALFKYRNINSNELHELLVSASDCRMVDSIPGWAHSIKNVGSEELIVILWANEIFDPQYPDTYKCEV